MMEIFSYVLRNYWGKLFYNLWMRNYKPLDFHYCLYARLLCGNIDLFYARELALFDRGFGHMGWCMGWS